MFELCKGLQYKYEVKAALVVSARWWTGGTFVNISQEFKCDNAPASALMKTAARRCSWYKFASFEDLVSRDATQANLQLPKDFN